MYSYYLLLKRPESADLGISTVAKMETTHTWGVD